jgi:hypothetical protein
MGLLRLASTGSKRIDLGDGDYLDVHEDLSKRDFNKLMKSIPQDFDADKGFTPGQADDFTTALFDALVVGWSIVDDKGRPVKPTVEYYLGLARESASLVDTKLVEHFNSLTPTVEESSKSEGDSA